MVCALATTEWRQKRIESPERRRAKHISIGIHMICIDAKYTNSVLDARVDIVVCVLDTVKTALNSNVCNYCTVVCNRSYKQLVSGF